MPKDRGKAAEDWVNEFAQKNRLLILNSKLPPLEKVVCLFNEKLQLRLQSARLHIDKSFSSANEWIDLILSNKQLPKGSSQTKKAELTSKLLDLVLATDLVITLKNHQGKDQIIAIDVTSDPKKETTKLNKIQGRREDSDPIKLNRNRNIPEVRKNLGIDKHVVLSINPKNPPNYEKLLAQLHYIANQPAKTGSINNWFPTSQKPIAQTPQELWHKYSQEISTDSPIQRQVAVAEKALQDGFADKLPDILASDPFVKKIQREQGKQKARFQVNLIIKAVNVKQNAPPNRQGDSPQRKQSRNSKLNN